MVLSGKYDLHLIWVRTVMACLGCLRHRPTLCGQWAPTRTTMAYLKVSCYVGMETHGIRYPHPELAGMETRCLEYQLCHPMMSGQLGNPIMIWFRRWCCTGTVVSGK